MPIPSDPRDAVRENRLLAVLPEDELERLLPGLELVELTFKQPCYEAGEPIRYVHFPLRGVVSLVAVLQGGGVIEVSTVGNEGMVGLPVFLGAETSTLAAFCQIPGRAARLGAPALRQAVRDGAALVRVLHRYTQALMTQLSQSVACNRLHSLQERCARWLLTTHDRAKADEFPMTHEFLALMLGTRRPSISVAAAVLQKSGAIRYVHGGITVLDRAGLEAAACECYGVVQEQFDELLGIPAG
jgi:CRP-like cAMP-binding protein